MSDRNNMQTPSERSLLWRWLAAAFAYPDEETWSWLTDPRTLRAINVPTLHAPDAPPTGSYLSIFGPTVRGDCPPYEIEYGELRADKLFQPHRLADIAAFYRAFGLELAENANERVDHVAMECEFYAVLCAKEALAGDQLEFCRDTQKKFLRDHLVRWTPAFSRRVERLSDDPFYRHAAAMLRAAVEAECARHGLQPGNADLQLRPVEDLTDPCGTCGLANVSFPGAIQRGE